MLVKKKGMEGQRAKRSDVPEHQLQKRRWLPWYKLPTIPLCPHCKTVCLVGKTLTGTDGKPVQHRYCETCTYSVKVPIAASEAK